MHHVHREQQRNAEPALLDRDALQLAQRLCPGDVEVRADLAAPHPLELVGREPRVERALPPAHPLDQLADLLGRGHAGEQRGEVGVGRDGDGGRFLRGQRRRRERQRGGKDW